MWSQSVEKTTNSTMPLAVEPLLVSEETAAQVLGISPRMVWELADKGDLRVRRIGRRKLYSYESLKAFAEGEAEVK